MPLIASVCNHGIASLDLKTTPVPCKLERIPGLMQLTARAIWLLKPAIPAVEHGREAIK